MKPCPTVGSRRLQLARGRIPIRILCSFAALILALAPIARAQTTQSSQPATRPASCVALRTERVVIFKNGHGLVVASGSATADAAGQAYITDVPDAAVLGCFWATAAGDARADAKGADGKPADKILAMRAEWVETKEIREHSTSCITIAEVIRANVGKTVTVTFPGRTEKGAAITEEGRIVGLLDVPSDDASNPDAPDLASGFPRFGGALQPGSITAYSSLIRDGVATGGSFTRDAIQDGGTVVRELVPRGGQLFVLAQENDRKLVLPIAQVQSILVNGEVGAVTTHREEVLSRSKRLSFDFGKESAGKPVSLRLFYFTPGLRWIPTYRVSGELKDKADLALQGEVINEVTDIENAALDLVVGVPSFRFEDTVSPLTLEQSMRTALASAGVNLANNAMMNSQFQNDNRGRVEPRRDDAALAIAPELLGSGGEQDLFVYKMGGFSLKKGARATVPLWQQTADLRHLYTFDLNTRRSRMSGGLLDDAANATEDSQQPGQGGRRSPNRIVLNQVWHQLELTNGGTVPWTTGAALLMREMLPLGQNLLVYTPPTGKALLPVTVAVDVRGTIDEEEVERKPKGLHFDGEDYLLIRKKGTITVNSFRKEKSTMRITLATGGKVLSASDDGKIKLNDFRAGDWDDSGTMRVNNHSDVTWEVDVEPGTTKTISYEMSFYTR